MELEKLQKIINNYSDVKVTESARLIEDLGLDSFLVVYFLTEVEECFDIDIDEEEFRYLFTVQDVIERIRKEEKRKVNAAEAMVKTQIVEIEEKV